MSDFKDLLDAAEAKYGLPRGLLHSQMKAESNGNPKAVSPVGAQGLMQFMPATAKEFGIDPFDPSQAIDGAGRYMNTLLKRYNNDVDSAIGAYNWGMGNVSKKGIARAPKETKDYIAKVKGGMAKDDEIIWDAPDDEIIWDAPAKPTKAVAPKVTPKKEGWSIGAPSLDNLTGNLKQLGFGGLRGAGSIGSTLLTAGELTPQAIIGNLIKGNGFKPFKNDKARRNAMDGGLRDLGANPDSGMYQTGKLGTEIAGTLGTGGAISPLLSKLPLLANSVKSGGMTLNGTTGSKALDMLTRVGGGSITGATSAGLIDPEYAATGAVVGGVLPPSLAGLGKTGAFLRDSSRSIVEPFYQLGQDKIIGRVLNEATGGNVDDAISNMLKTSPVQGFNPTVAQSSGDAGLAALSNAASSVSPRAKDELARRAVSNNDALVDALQRITPDRQAAVATRESAVKPLYDAVKNAPVNITPELDALLQRPSMANAVNRGKSLALETGDSLNPEALTGQGAQFLKMGLDDMANSSPLSGIGGNELRAIQSTRGDFIQELEKQIPEYVQANKVYADMSKPVNQADVLTEILTKAQDNFGNITPNRGMGAISDRVAQRVLGRDNATLANTLAPEQLSQLEALQKVLTSMNFAQNAGKATGSNTVQNAAYANILNQFGVPNLLRNSSVGGVVGGILSKVGDVAYKKANQEISERMAMSLLDPQTAAKLMQGVKPTQSQSLQYLPNLVKTLPALVNSNRQ